MASLSTAPYKGTRDFYPEDMRVRQWMFAKLRQTVGRFGYLEYDGPMLEPLELYAAKSGEELVNNQLFSLIDRGDRKLAVRPEMTPTLARMVAGKLNELPKPIRWYSIPNLWRYERPQRGRLREHWQLNVDVIGGDALYADVEIIQVALSLMQGFGGEKHIRVRVNHRGIMDTLFQKKLGLSAADTLKASKAIDAREKIGEKAFQEWLAELGLKAESVQALEKFFKSSFEQICKDVPCAGTDHLKSVLSLLKDSGAGGQVVYDPTIMRGLDYYTGMVFEVYDISPENPRAMFGGGRYDNLIGLFGGGKASEQFSGVGFGMGDVTLQNFLETHKLLPEVKNTVDVYVSFPSTELGATSEKIAQELRETGCSVVTPLSAGGFGAQLKQASKLGAHFVVLFGEEELKKGQALLKDLNSGEQSAHSLTGLVKEVQNRLKKGNP